MKTAVEELPDSRVRLEVEVPEADVKHALEHAAADLAGSMRVPGFRKGKVPLPLVVARVGREALWEEALRTHLDSWFWSAAVSSGIRPVGRPEVELDAVPADGGAFRFAATVPVLRKAELADWTELEVPSAEPDVPVGLVEQELEQVRASVAELVPVADRPVREGDTVVLDIVGEAAGTQRDYVVDVGSGRLVDEIEQELPGMSPGETKTLELAVDEGPATTVDVTVKEVKEKLLPALDDDLAKTATEFDTLAELREDVEARLRAEIAAELEVKFREDAVDALVAASAVEGTEPLVERRTAELWAGLVRSLEQRGISPETYLKATGQAQEEVLARLREQAERAVKRELVLDAVADDLGLEVADEEVEELVREQASAAGDDVDAAVALLRERGTFEQLRGDLRLRKALDEIVAGVKRVPADVARVREKLWTPEKESGGTGVKIWTPGSEEAK